jgi:carbon starvation protein
VHESPYWSQVLGFRSIKLAWIIIGYGFAASVLPVWLLLAPRDYLSTFMKLGTIFALALGILLVRPDLQMPALTPFTNGLGLVVPGKIFPFCFITIACGSISGFHTLIASGTTPKMITRESHARPIGYGAMCLESFVAIMALIAACTLQPGVYLGMNVASTGADSQAKAAAITQKVQAAGANFTVDAAAMDQLADEVKEKTLFNRAGGAATLAAGMANIFSNVTHGRWLDLWYHFAIMFEALFILTTIDAGTRVGRYILQDFLGNLWKPLGDTKKLHANLLASGLMVCGWGYFLIQGVLDPLGGINSLWPLFGIANQMLAAIALCLATTMLLKMGLQRSAGVSPAQSGKGNSPAARTGETPVLRSPAIALVTLIPLVWLLAATMTAGVQKIWHSDPRIGFLAQARLLKADIDRFERIEKDAGNPGSRISIPDSVKEPALLRTAATELPKDRTLYFNNIVDAVVAGIFLILVAAIVLMSVREWILLLARKKIAELRESPPVWLPDYALAEAKPLNFLGLITLGFALAKELSGEAPLERAQQVAAHCPCAPERTGPLDRTKASPAKTPEQVYLEATEARFKGINRCC